MRKKEAWVLAGALVLSLIAFFVTSRTGTTQAETSPLIIAIVTATPAPTETPKATPTPTPSPTPTPKVGAGCTPGFWKTHPGAWGPTGFTTGQTLESVFDVPDSLGLDNFTLLQALDFGGGSGAVGGARTLLREAVAALLNSASGFGYPLTTADVITRTNGALASLNRSTMLTLASELGADNSLGCPLN